MKISRLLKKLSSIFLREERFVSTRLARLPVPKLRASSRHTGLNVKGLELIDLASGASENDTPEALKQAAVNAIVSGENQYGPAAGDLLLRKAYSAHVAASTGVAVDPDKELTVVSGTSAALAATLLATLNQGDEVLIFEPFFEGYLQAIALAGGVARPVPLVREPSVGFVSLSLTPFSNWAVDEATLAAAVNSRTRVILLNSPHNPTGRVFNHDELAVIASLAREFDLLVIADEVYAPLVFGEAKHESIRSLPGMKERTVVLDGMSKTHSVAGWRIGFIVAPERITAQIRRLQTALGLSVPTPLAVACRSAFAAADDGCASALAAQTAAMKASTEAAGDALARALERAGFALSRPQGATYILANRDAVYREGGGSLASFLEEELGILSVAGDAFFSGEEGSRWVRLCFARNAATIEAAVKRLSAIKR